MMRIMIVMIIRKSNEILFMNNLVAIRIIILLHTMYRDNNYYNYYYTMVVPYRRVYLCSANTCRFNNINE